MSNPSDPETPRQRAERVLEKHRRAFDGGCWPCDSPTPCLYARVAQDVIALSDENQRLRETVERQAWSYDSRGYAPDERGFNSAKAALRELGLWKEPVDGSS